MAAGSTHCHIYCQLLRDDVCRRSEGASYIRAVSTVGLGPWDTGLFTSVSDLTNRDSDAAVGEEIGPRILSFVDYISIKM